MMKNTCLNANYEKKTISSMCILPAQEASWKVGLNRMTVRKADPQAFDDVREHHRVPMAIY